MKPRVLLTRDPGGCAAWGARLEASGVEAVAWPCLDHAWSSDGKLAQELEEALTAGAWLALASARGAEAVQHWLRKPFAELAPRPKVATVGEQTRRRAEEVLGSVDLVAEPSTSAGLATSLLRHGLRSGESVVSVTSDRGRRDLESILGEAGVSTQRLELYSTRPWPAGGRRQRPPAADAAFLASPSAVRGLLNRGRVPAELPLITIGPTTSSAVVDAGLRVAAQAERPSFEGLLAAFDALAAAGPSSAVPGSRAATRS